MGVSLSWDESQPTVIILTLTEEWTFREALSHYERALQITNKASFNVTLIVDLSQTSYLPASGLMDTILRAYQMTYPAHPHMAAAVLVMQPSTVRDMLFIACQRVIKNDDRPRLSVVNSLGEAFDRMSAHFNLT